MGTAVDIENLARDPRRSIRSEEEHRFGNVAWQPITSERSVLGEVRLNSRHTGETLDKWRFDKTWRNRVDAYPPVSEFECRNLGEHGEASFGGAVSCKTCSRLACVQ